MFACVYAVVCVCFIGIAPRWNHESSRAKTDCKHSVETWNCGMIAGLTNHSSQGRAYIWLVQTRSTKHVHTYIEKPSGPMFILFPNSWLCISNVIACQHLNSLLAVATIVKATFQIQRHKCSSLYGELIHFMTLPSEPATYIFDVKILIAFCWFWLLPFHSDVTLFVSS